MTQKNKPQASLVGIGNLGGLIFDIAAGYVQKNDVRYVMDTMHLGYSFGIQTYSQKKWAEIAQQSVDRLGPIYT